MCVGAECRQSRLAATQLAAESLLLGWLSFLAMTTKTTTTTDGKIHNQNSLTYLWRTTEILMKFMAYHWNPNEIYGAPLVYHWKPKKFATAYD